MYICTSIFSQAVRNPKPNFRLGAIKPLYLISRGFFILRQKIGRNGAKMEVVDLSAVSACE